MKKKFPVIVQRFIFILMILLRPSAGRALELGPLHPDFSAQTKTLNFFTKTTGLNPELAENPLARGERGEEVFQSMERARLKLRLPFEMNDNHRVVLKLDYDHQAHFGSFVKTGDFRLANYFSEEKQFLDLSQTLVEGDAVYLHRLYRASIRYAGPWLSLEIGRQQIPWGVGQFFTPTDVFNPFSPTQIELEERDGTDAIDIKTSEWKGYTGEFIYTPRGRRLHPQRFMGRISRDIKDYEVGILGGKIQRDHSVGFDFQGNLRNSAVRGESLYRITDEGKDYVSFTVNMDYNFPKNILGLIEYHFNGQGRRTPKDYQTDLFLRGEVRDLAKNYGAVLVQHDLTSLCKISNRLIMNMDDVSFYVRPEAQYEVLANLFLLVGAQLYLGDEDKGDEYATGQHLYFGEARYSF